MRVPRNPNPILSRDRDGLAAVETAVFLPIILTLALGILEFGRILEVQQGLCVAARDAARQGGSGLMSNSQVQQTALYSIKQMLGDASGVMTKNVVVTVSVGTNTNPSVVKPIDVSQAAPLDLVKVTVSIPYRDVCWITSPLVTEVTTLQAESTWLSLKDLPYPTTTPQPPQG